MILARLEQPDGLVDGDGGRVEAATHLREQGGCEELKGVGGASGVTGDLDNLVAILDTVKPMNSLKVFYLFYQAPKA